MCRPAVETVGQCTYNEKLRRVRITIDKMENVICIAYYECVLVAIINHHAMRMSFIILSPVVSPAIQYFPTLSHKRRHLRGGNNIEHKIVFRCYVQTCVKHFSF